MAHRGEDPYGEGRVDVHRFACTVDHHRHRGIESKALEEVSIPRRVEELHRHAALAGAKSLDVEVLCLRQVALQIRPYIESHVEQPHRQSALLPCRQRVSAKQLWHGGSHLLRPRARWKPAHRGSEQDRAPPAHFPFPGGWSVPSPMTSRSIST